MLLRLKQAISDGVYHSTVSMFDIRRCNTREHIVRFLDFIGAHSNGTGLCMRGFLKSLTDRAYIPACELKPGSGA